MLTRSAILATTLAIGLVVVVGSSAFAVAFVPGNESGSAQKVDAIAVPTQDAAGGSSDSFIQGGAVTVVVPEAIVIDGSRAENPAEGGPQATTPTSGPESTEPVQTGSGNSGPSAAEKAAEKQAKKEQKAAEEQAKKDRKAAEEQAKKDKKDEDTTVVDTVE